MQYCLEIREHNSQKKKKEEEEAGINEFIVYSLHLVPCIFQAKHPVMNGHNLERNGIYFIINAKTTDEDYKNKLCVTIKSLFEINDN